MDIFTTNQPCQICLVDPDQKKADQLRATLNTAIHYFSNVPLFINHLNAMVNARACLSVIVPEHLIRELPPDIIEKVRRIFIYYKNNHNKSQTFNDVCLHLSGLIIAEWTAQSIHYHNLNENGLARIRAQESIAQSENHIAHLQSLCDDIDGNILPSQEATS